MRSRNNRGFSIIGVIVAAGMLGGLVLVLAKLTRQQHVSQKKSETMAELTVLHQKVLSVFYDGESCTKTLGPGAILRVGDKISQLKNREGSVVLEEGKTYNRLLKVVSMKILAIQGSVAKTRELDIEIIFEKQGAANTGYNKVTKVFSITVELSAVTPSMTLDRCHHTLDGKEQGIKEQMCTDMGGVMVPIPGTAITRCSVDNLYQKFCQNMGGDYTTAPDMECSVAPILQKLCDSLGGTWDGTDCDIASVYANVTGDTMLGDFHTKNVSCIHLNCPNQNVHADGEVSAEGGNIPGMPTSDEIAAFLVEREKAVAKKECSDKGGWLVDANVYATCADYLPKEKETWASYPGGHRYNVLEVFPAPVRPAQAALIKRHGGLCCTNKVACKPGYFSSSYTRNFPTGEVRFHRCVPDFARSVPNCGVEQADTDLPCTPLPFCDEVLNPNIPCRNRPDPPL